MEKTLENYGLHPADADALRACGITTPRKLLGATVTEAGRRIIRDFLGMTDEQLDRLLAAIRADTPEDVLREMEEALGHDLPPMGLVVSEPPQAEDEPGGDEVEDHGKRPDDADRPTD